MVMFWLLPVPRSLADTLTMPLASMSKVTSIWGTPRGARRDAQELELAQGAVVARHLPLALQDVDLDRGLAVGGGGEDLALLGGDGGVALDEPGEDAAQGLDAEGERGDVEEEEVLHLAREHARLDGRAHRHHLVGVDPLVGLLAEELLHQLLHLGDAGRCRPPAPPRRCPWARPRRPSCTGAPAPWTSPAGRPPAAPAWPG